MFSVFLVLKSSNTLTDLAAKSLIAGSLKLVILHAFGTWRAGFSSEISHGLPAFTVPETVHYACPVWHLRQKYFSKVFVELFYLL